MENTYDLDTNEKSVKEDTDQGVIEVDNTILSFNRTPLITRRAISRQNKAHGGGLYITPGPGGVIQPTIEDAGLDEPIFGGECVPVEFGKSSVLKQLTNGGFQEFCLAVAFMLDKLKDAKVSLNIIAFPEGKKFSFCLNGQKRTCAILLIERPNRQSCYILEILRPDGWTVSTLIVKAKSNVSSQQLDYFIHSLLVKLFGAGGHWTENIYNQMFIVERLKHIEDQEPRKWGLRILEKIS